LEKARVEHRGVAEDAVAIGGSLIGCVGGEGLDLRVEGWGSGGKIPKLEGKPNCTQNKPDCTSDVEELLAKCHMEEAADHTKATLGRVGALMGDSAIGVGVPTLVLNCWVTVGDLAEAYGGGAGAERGWEEHVLDAAIEGNNAHTGDVQECPAAL
jgi:hypothetical protein